ncbi:hypothetical protein SCA6_007421 [Theobroma cacao]
MASVSVRVLGAWGSCFERLQNPLNQNQDDVKTSNVQLLLEVTNLLPTQLKGHKMMLNYELSWKKLLMPCVLMIRIRLDLQFICCKEVYTIGEKK